MSHWYDAFVDRAVQLVNRHHLGECSRTRLIHAAAERLRQGVGETEVDEMIANAIETARDSEASRADYLRRASVRARGAA